jgi:hypothetical protein
MTGLLTGQSSIRPMRCTGLLASGTVLWSALLPTSRETAITRTEQGLKQGRGGGVRPSLPLRRSHRGLTAGESHPALMLLPGRRT